MCLLAKIPSSHLVRPRRFGRACLMSLAMILSPWWWWWMYALAPRASCTWSDLFFCPFGIVSEALFSSCRLCLLFNLSVRSFSHLLWLVLRTRLSTLDLVCCSLCVAFFSFSLIGTWLGATNSWSYLRTRSPSCSAFNHDSLSGDIQYLLYERLAISQQCILICSQEYYYSFKIVFYLGEDVGWFKKKSELQLLKFRAQRTTPGEWSTFVIDKVSHSGRDHSIVFYENNLRLGGIHWKTEHGLLTRSGRDTPRRYPYLY